MLKFPYIFHKSVVLRTPRVPFKSSFDKNDILDFFKQNFAQEALYIASPALFNKYTSFINGKDLEKKEVNRLYSSLSRYCSRMHTRATPFGLFAGVGVVDWQDYNSKVVISNDINRHTRLDMDYLCNLSDFISGLDYVRNKILFYPNSSIFINNDSIRYIEYKKISGKRVHQVSAVGSSPYLLSVLSKSKTGMSIHELALCLLEMDEEIPYEDAEGFINTLIDEQILVSELEHSVTGKEYFEKILEIINRISDDAHTEFKALKSNLTELNEKLRYIDQAGVVPVEEYTLLDNILKKFEVEFIEGRYLQIDMSVPVLDGGLDKNLQKDIFKALNFINIFSVENENEDLKIFKNKFIERYESDEVQLLELLDMDHGIGYGNMKLKDENWLSKDIFTQQKFDKKNQITLDKVLIWKISKILNAKKDGLFEVNIKDEDLEGFEANWDNLPPSFSVMFRILENDQIFIENVGHSSATNLLARFAFCNEQINEIIHEIAEWEQEKNENVIISEIAHLPEDRLGNILQRPSFRKSEIPYLAQSYLDYENKITLDDIYVTIVNDKVILRSKKHDKEIIPRLGTAHNFQMSTHPVYRFLCDLQFQNIKHPLYFSWGNAESFSNFLPRVKIGNVIIFRATWNFQKKDFQHILKSDEDKLVSVVNDFINKHQIPEVFYHSDFDNDLLVKTDNLLSIIGWVDAMKNAHNIVIKEYLADNFTICNEDRKMYSNQFVASLLRTVGSYDSTNRPKRYNDSGIKNLHFIGSNWIYYKIYAGEKSIEKILLDVIYPATEELIRNGIIEKWFFVRFWDPDHHLRLRCYLSKKFNLDAVNSVIKKYLHHFEQNDMVSKVQLDTYHQEVERYGLISMETAESLFFVDSKSILTYLNDNKNNDSEGHRWKWSIKYINTLLDLLKFRIEEKIELFKMLSEFFNSEFGVQKYTTNQISLKFRSLREDIVNIIEKQELREFVGLEESFQENERICQKLLEYCVQGKTPTKYDLAMSFIHMHLNRLFHSYQRKQELVIYNFLLKYYNSRQALDMKAQANKQIEVI